MIRFFTTHPTVANLLMIGFIEAGFAAVPKLQREIFTQI
jgi:HAE1 family hydrophobic/amphiphilic exporter-1